MTAEDRGAGVQAETLVLTVRPEGAAPVPLPLHEAEPLIGDWAGTARHGGGRARVA